MVEAGICEFMSPLVKESPHSGIVVDVLEEADTSEELKAIVEVLDYTPVLNQEQFWLADQLRKVFFL